MKEAMPQRLYSRWQSYFVAEPWGPWRDNMHTAILAREIRRTIPGAKLPDMSVWMIRDPEERAAEATGQVLSTLGTMAVKIGAKEATRKLKAERSTRRDRLRKRKR
jgi:hypothetical protein